MSRARVSGDDGASAWAWKFELNKLYWTLDPDPMVSSLTRICPCILRQEDKAGGEKAARAPQPQAPWVPSGDGLPVRRVVSEDRSGAYTSGTPFGTLAKQRRDAMREREADASTVAGKRPWRSLRALSDDESVAAERAHACCMTRKQATSGEIESQPGACEAAPPACAGE